MRRLAGFLEWLNLKLIQVENARHLAGFLIELVGRCPIKALEVIQLVSVAILEVLGRPIDSPNNGDEDQCTNQVAQAAGSFRASTIGIFSGHNSVRIEAEVRLRTQAT